MTKLYFPFQIRDMQPADIRSAYVKMRKAANQRLTRMEKAGLGTMGSYRFPKVRDLTESQMAAELAEASRYMRDPRHTVPGERRFMKDELDKLHDMGYDWINESNFYEFTDFMDDLREQYGNKAFDSGDAADVFNNAQKIGIDPDVVKENFDYFAEHLSEMERMKPARSAAGATLPAVKRKIARLTK